MNTNTQVKLAKRPVGLPDDACWSIEKNPIDTLQEGEVLVQTQFISLDPAMRGWMNEGKSYIRPVQIGEVMRAGTAGVVVESKNAHFKPGDPVVGSWGVQSYAVVDGSVMRPVQKVDISFTGLPTYLGTLGIAGLTGYFAFLDVGKPNTGEIVLISGAAGAVGMVVGQIAKIKGCKAIGIAGSDDKCQYVVQELGFDACINYKTQDIRKSLKELCPEGIDIYFDNVGGDILDIALTQIRKKARIVICGAISQYNATTAVKGPANYLSLLVNRARMEGMVVFDYQDQYPQGIAEMSKWMKEGKLKTKEYVVEGGIETFPATLLKLFTGENTGKLVLQVKP